MSIFNKKPYIAAVSGGPDSIAMLHMYRRHIKAVCVVKYNKRIDCDYDLRCVQKICDKYKIMCEVLDVDSQVYEMYSYESNFQNQARLIRYDFFVEIGKKYHASKILVAHHLDDFLETAYIDLMKKSQKLYYGIPNFSIYKNMTICRPFLMRYRKNTLIRYCNELGLEYAIDSTNDNDLYERNRIRKIIQSKTQNEIHTLLQQINKYNKSNSSKIKQISNLLSDWKQTKFSISWFSSIDDDLKSNLIYCFLSENNIFRPSSNKINSVIQFISSKKNGRFRLENNIYLEKENGLLVLKKEVIECVN